MADLIERLMGVHPTRSKIPVHQFQAIAAEWARGNFTGAQAQTAIEAVSGTPLSAAEQTEAQAIVNGFTSIPVTGSATAVADGRARRALRLAEIDQVFLLVDAQVPPYDNPAAVRTRLGLP